MDGSSIMDVWQIRERGLNASDLVVVSNINLFVQPFPRYLIKEGYRVGGRGAGVVVCIELKYVRIM